MKLENIVGELFLKISYLYGKEYEVKILEVGQAAADTSKNKIMYFQNSTNTEVEASYNKVTKLLSTTKEVQFIIQTTEEPDKISQDVLSIILAFSNNVIYDINPANAFKTATKNDLKKLNINYIVYTFTLTTIEIKNILCMNC